MRSIKLLSEILILDCSSSCHSVPNLFGSKDIIQKSKDIIQHDSCALIIFRIGSIGVISMGETISGFSTLCNKLP